MRQAMVQHLHDLTIRHFVRSYFLGFRGQAGGESSTESARVRIGLLGASQVMTWQLDEVPQGTRPLLTYILMSITAHTSRCPLTLLCGLLGAYQAARSLPWLRGMESERRTLLAGIGERGAEVTPSSVGAPL